MPNFRAIAPVVFCILAAIALWFRAQEHRRTEWSTPLPIHDGGVVHDAGGRGLDAGSSPPTVLWRFELKMTSPSAGGLGQPAARAFLQRRGATDEAANVHRITLADGNHLRFTEQPDDAGAAGVWRVQLDATLQELSAPTLAFLFELASEGMFVIDGADVAIVTSDAAATQMPDAEHVTSPDELGVLLKLGLGDWKRRYRHD